MWGWGGSMLCAVTRNEQAEALLVLTEHTV